MRRRLLLWMVAMPAAVLVSAVAGAMYIAQSNWFQNQVKQKIVTIVEDATGGRLEIGRFNYDWRHLTASVAPFVLHGTEPAGVAPLLRASKVEVGLRVISLLERQVDLKFLTLDEPALHILVLPDGRTNVPSPRLLRSPTKDLIQDILNMKIQEFTLRNGTADYNSHRVPLNANARDVSARFGYSETGPSYTGELNARDLRVNCPEIDEARFEMQSQVALSHAGVEVKAIRLSSKGSQIELSGMIADPASPHGSLNVKARVRPADINKPFRIPLSDTGEASFTGQATFQMSPVVDWEVQGNANAKGLGYHDRFVSLNNVSAISAVKLTKERLDLQNLTASTLDGTFRGRLQATDWRKVTIDGDARGLSLRMLMNLVKVRENKLDARVSGPVHLETLLSRQGFQETTAKGKVTLQAVSGSIPVEGFVDGSYEQRTGSFVLGNSALNLGASHMDLSGTLGQVLRIHASSLNPADLEWALPLIGAPVPEHLPVLLPGGTGKFDGIVSGAVDNPEIGGIIDLSKFTAQGQNFDRLSSDFDLDRAKLTARSLTLVQGLFHFSGKGEVGLEDWKLVDSSKLSGSITMRGAEIKRLLEDRGSKLPVTGILAGTAVLKGTWGAPELTAGVDAENVTAYDEHADRVRASVIVSSNTVQVIDLRVQAGAARVQGSGTYQRAGTDWESGQLRFDLDANQLALAQIHHVQEFRKGLGGSVQTKAQGTARWTKGAPRVETITSETNVQDISYDGRSYGHLKLSANNRGVILDVKANALLLNTAITGSGEWKLEGDDPGQGTILVPRLSVATMHEFMASASRKELPFEGYVEGKIDVNGPLRKPAEMKAVVEISTLQINASASATPRAGARASDLVLRNVRPIVLDATSKGIEVRSAQLTGTATTINATGTLSSDAKAPWDLQVKGGINLAILQIFNPDLLGSGVSVVDAVVRGSWDEPQVEGRLELKNASLYVKDLTNGLDQANGVILFDRNRATVDSLSATTGGGNVAIQKGSFIGFRGPALQYRLQGSADHVRYRSPEGVSITVSALLNLIGTSESSVLSGTMTVMRAGFNPTTDVGSLLAATTRPVSVAAVPSEYLKGMQFDVKVESAQSLEIQTNLTRNIQAEANLRVRGTPDKPVVLGRLNVNEGEIEFFGNKYRINRGDVNLYNPVKIEPIIDMDLETQVRGITVDISFSGPLNKLNFSYRSDPPLQTNDIIALLAVGRTPATGGSSIAASDSGGNTSALGTGSNTLLAQAISAPAAGRLQRFFGVSHIKIDPQLTDVTAVPQARLTLEQQVSKDITLTYITNLTRTQEQILRLEWDLDRHWSVIALRDENGEFGIDFQYRKSFK